MRHKKKRKRKNMSSKKMKGSFSLTTLPEQTLSHQITNIQILMTSNSTLKLYSNLIHNSFLQMITFNKKNKKMMTLATKTKMTKII
jgi:hypothetical protein